MSKVVGWIIFLEEEDENGDINLVDWNISNWLANEIDVEYAELLENMEGEEE